MISKFQYITQGLENFSHAQLAEFACMGGADWVQLRVKGKPIPGPSQREGGNYFNKLLEIAEATKKICKKHNAKFIVNDYVHIAKEVVADGVHLGKTDMNPRAARKILGNNFIIGGSANTMDDVRWMMDEGYDYIGVGPYRFTTTKEKLNPVLGLDEIRTIREQCANEKINIPLIAIGGIRIEDIEPLMRTSIYGIAVSSAVNLSNDPGKTVKSFLTELKMYS